MQSVASNQVSKALLPPTAISPVRDLSRMLGQYPILTKKSTFTKKGHLKIYLHYKTILCHKVALDAQLIIFFVLEISRFLCFFLKSIDFRICDVIEGIAT